MHYLHLKDVFAALALAGCFVIAKNWHTSSVIVFSIVEISESFLVTKLVPHLDATFISWLYSLFDEFHEGK